MRNLNQKTINFIKEFEACKLSPYKDLVGVWTIGWGTTYYPDGTKVTSKDKAITQNQADFFLLHEIDQKAEIVGNFLDKIGVLLNDNQFGALVSFAYNCGPGPIIEGGRSLNIALKSGSLVKVADTILIYNKGKVLGVKVVIKGLKRRREAERVLFLS